MFPIPSQAAAAISLFFFPSPTNTRNCKQYKVEQVLSLHCLACALFYYFLKFCLLVARDFTTKGGASLIHQPLHPRLTKSLRVYKSVKNESVLGKTCFLGLSLSAWSSWETWKCIHSVRTPHLQHRCMMLELATVPRVNPSSSKGTDKNRSFGCF